MLDTKFRRDLTFEKFCQDPKTLISEGALTLGGFAGIHVCVCVCLCDYVHVCVCVSMSMSLF